MGLAKRFGLNTSSSAVVGSIEYFAGVGLNIFGSIKTLIQSG